MYKPTQLLPVFLILLSGPVYAQAPAQYEPPKWSGRVEVRIYADQVNAEERNGVKSAIETYLKRELRSLNDITVIPEAKDELDWVIWINIKDITLGKNRLGYAISMSAVQRPFAETFINAWLKPQTSPPSSIKELIDAFSQGYKFRGSQVYVATPIQLQETCKLIVDEVDISFFEPVRKQVEEAREAIIASRKRNPQQ